MNLTNYSKTKENFWTGRIDDPEDLDSYRMHQIVQLLDIRHLNKETLNITNISVCFLGFCCDEGIVRNLGRPGAKKGPEYIRKEFANLPVTFGNKLSVYDAGDIHCIGNAMEEAQKQLSVAVKILLDHKLFPIVLGGGHEIALGHYKGIINHLNNQKLGIINFDAHLDLRPHNNGGSSGTMFSQIADICKNTNPEFSYLCIGAQTYANTISLFKRADSLAAKYILAKDVTEPKLTFSLEKIQAFIQENDQLYVTLDSDVFNSAYAPGVSSMQPFGMNPEMVLFLLKEVFKTKKVVSFDVAEVSPRFDKDNHTAKLIAVIVYAIINTLTEFE